jgi:hypothetical protein
MAFDLSSALPYFSSASSPEDTAPVFAYGQADAPILRIFSKSLIVHYVIDEPGALVYVRERDVCEALRDDLHQCAIDNLRRRTAARRIRYEARGATQHAKWDGQYDAALLLLDELWDHRGDGLVAAVPARNRLLFAETKSGLEELRSQTSKPSLSPELFVRRNRAWAPV